MKIADLTTAFLMANQHTFLPNTRLAHGYDLGLFSRAFPDLDTLAGTWSAADADEFRHAIGDLEKIDANLWRLVRQTPSVAEQALIDMANDESIQQELQHIATEFAHADFDGLDEQQ